ncbi:MAG: ABC transporter permease [Rhodospirillaceae bacterium]|jgi:putative hydroxymethylpyrimidine transport system permease protein|nr:ABC transporter permease [Rhodospirillaceae bacterium]MBT4038642.1 ABC transporter permease [Rhodospirillales bacterium]MBT4627083.1 ABC transporter permease [Rhodospirillales bacterium]MBT5350635.1 ABC transporter permease [Rhodospirillales bacterium]MBT5521492.1 ABC transporter permease [Rhodospirillales bacterium]
MNSLIRAIIIACGLVSVWQVIVWITQAPPYILPGPATVAQVLVDRMSMIAPHAGVTALEIILGAVLGIAVGLSTALTMAYFRPVQRWLLPVLVASQAVPVFALAPLLTLWLGYGMSSKVFMAALIIYFPVTATFLDGLRRTEPGWVDLARTMGATPWAVLRHIRLPAALPAAASGIRVAIAVAPIGAIVGEWVGSSQGLGYLMLHANARMQIDVMFAALLVLTAMGLALYFIMDFLLRRIVAWQPDTQANVSH